MPTQIRRSSWKRVKKNQSFSKIFIFRKKTPPYIPDFKKAFQHFCIHAGGRAIIDGLEENLKVMPMGRMCRLLISLVGATSSGAIESYIV